MDEFLKIAGLAIIAGLLCMVVRPYTPILSGLLSLGACTLILLLAVSFMTPVLELLQLLREMTGMTRAVTAPLYKSVGIGILTQISGAICEDAGEKTLSKAVEIGGTILSIYVTLPLLSALLSILQEALGG